MRKGRPRKPEKERRAIMALVRLTRAEHQKLLALARRRKTTLGGLLRELALKEAK